MPVYIFETDAGVGTPCRAEMERPDLRAAKVEAVRYLGELLADDGPEFWQREEVSMTVSDHTGLLLFRLCLFGTDAPAAAASGAEQQMMA